MEAKISKAEQTRRRQAREYIDNSLRRKLIEFQNDYLNHAQEWSVRKIEIEIKDYQEIIAKLEEKQKSEPALKGIEYKIEAYQNRIRNCQRTIQLDAILKLKALTEAQKSYDAKISKVVDVLVDEGFDYRFFKIEEIENCTSKDLEFLISNDKKEVHARLIFAHGPIKAPHFRFITTVRQKS